MNGQTADLLRLYVVGASIACSIFSFMVAKRAKKYRVFAFIGAVVPLEWVLFYLCRVLNTFEPLDLNVISLLITAQSLTFYFGYLIFVYAAVK